MAEGNENDGKTVSRPPGHWKIEMLFDFHLDDWLIMQSCDLSIQHGDHWTKITGFLEDISAVYGLLNNLKDRGIPFTRLSLVQAPLASEGD